MFWLLYIFRVLLDLILVFLYPCCFIFCNLLESDEGTMILFIILAENSIVAVIIRIVEESNPLSQLLSQMSKISIIVKADRAVQLILVEY